eukprot:3048650-Pyramimonas_sp.AAC.1
MPLWPSQERVYTDHELRMGPARIGEVVSSRPLEGRGPSSPTRGPQEGLPGGSREAQRRGPPRGTVGGDIRTLPPINIDSPESMGGGGRAR